MRVFRTGLLLISLAATAGAQSGGPTGDVLPFRATETTLANGLKVIIVPTGFPNLIGIQIPVQTGARNETEPGTSGYGQPPSWPTLRLR
jgi:zinc protease